MYLQDVIQFDIKVKDPILAYEYDYKVEKSKEKREYINEKSNPPAMLGRME